MLYNLIIFIILIVAIYYFYSNLETFNTDADEQAGGGGEFDVDAAVAAARARQESFEKKYEIGYNLHKKYSEIIADKNIPWNIRRSSLLEIEKKLGKVPRGEHPRDRSQRRERELEEEWARGACVNGCARVPPDDYVVCRHAISTPPSSSRVSRSALGSRS